MRIGAEEHEGALTRANNLQIASMKSTMPDAAESAAINQAIGDKRLNLQAVNSRNAKIIGSALIANPGLNAIQLNALAHLDADPAVQMKTGMLGSVSTVLKGVYSAGAKLNLSNFSPLGDAEIAGKKLFNSPDWTDLANRRVDASQTLAAIMGASGATNVRTLMEQKAAAENMSPRAWSGWYKAQIGGVASAYAMG